MNLGMEPESLDPRKARELAAQTLTRMLFEGLVRLSKDDVPELALAKSVEVSPDLKTYTFHLRHTEWSNGDPVTAYDFEYAWKKVLSPNFATDLAAQLYVIKKGKNAKQGKCSLEEVGIFCSDPLTLRIELENPTPYFLDLLALPVFFPVNQRVDKEDPFWHTKSESFVSNGPFVLKKWEHENFIEAKKNGKYWDKDAVKLPKIHLVMVATDTEFNMFEKEELDWAGSPLSSLPLDALPPLKEKGILKVKPFLNSYFLRVNTEKVPFNSELLRKAFALAIDRQAIALHITYGSRVAATGLVPLSLGLQKEAYFKDGDVDAARILFETALKELNLEKKDFPEVSILYATGERNHIVTQAIVEQWYKAFGVRIKLENQEPKVYFSSISKQNYDLASCNWIGDFNDPINFLEVFKYKKPGSNNTGWENQEYKDLLDASTLAIAPEERSVLLQRSEKILLENMPIIPLFYSTMLYTNKTRVKDVAISSMGSIDFKWASLNDGEEK